jgi:3-deoxy-manno-octulosonate cytidylyltransferase (CMP-KDO synthetase)
LPRTVALIPARMASTRFPGKPLASATGKPMIHHVYERALKARGIDLVAVATDDELIVAAVRDFGGRAIMTRADHPNGTSRLAEAASTLGLAPNDAVINVQGDEPELEPTLIERVAKQLREGPWPMATIAMPCDPGDETNPNVVKVVCRLDGRALYFSRLGIPFDREGQNAVGDSRQPDWLRHVGLYAYRAGFLAAYPTLTPTPLEAREQLEQLRVLEHGHEIGVAVVRGVASPAGIDTPEQYQAFVARYVAR